MVTLVRISYGMSFVPVDLSNFVNMDYLNPYCTLLTTNEIRIRKFNSFLVGCCLLELYPPLSYIEEMKMSTFDPKID